MMFTPEVSEKLRSYVDTLATRVLKQITGDVTHVPVAIPYEELVALGVDVAETVHKKPIAVINAIAGMLSEKVKQTMLGAEHVKFDVGIAALPPFSLATGIGYIKLGELRNIHIHKYIETEGVATRIGQPHPFVAKKAFVCNRCGATVYLERRNSLVPFQSPPRECPNESCGGLLTPDESGDEYEDEQFIVIQELPEVAGEREPRRVMAVLTGSLVGIIKPLHQVKIAGEVSLCPKKGDDVDYYIHTYVLTEVSYKYRELDISPEEEQRIRELVAKDPNIIMNMANTLLPYLKIDPVIKVGLLLQQIRGVELDLPSLKVGDAIHCAWLGDPGVAKSEAARRIARIVPGGSYIMATAATKAGVTAMAEKDPYTGEWRLVVGQIPLSHESTSVIDELDKFALSPGGKDAIAGIRQIASQQTLKIDKGGIHAEIPANVSLLFLFNPIGGGRLSDKPPAEQLPTVFDESLRSRIDLFFVTRDVPDEVYDRELASHILLLYKGERKAAFLEPPVYTDDELRKYIYLARKIRPVLTDEAINVLQEFYVSLRKISKISDRMIVPIGIRQLETLVKLTMAIAKAKFSPVATAEHAKEATELYRATLVMWGVIDAKTGIIDFAALTGTAPKSTTEKMALVVNYLKSVDPECKGVPESELIAELRKQGVDDPEKLLETMVKKGELFKPTPHKYALVKA